MVCKFSPLWEAISSWRNKKLPKLYDRKQCVDMELEKAMNMTAVSVLQLFQLLNLFHLEISESRVIIVIKISKLKV